MPTTVVWFRRDLRLSDNPALVAAVAAAKDGAAADRRVVGLFCLDPRLTGPAGRPRLAFLHDCLRALDRSIDGRLVVRRGDPATVVPRLAAEVGATAVFAADDFGPYGTERDAAVERALADQGDIALERVGSPYAVAPGLVRTNAGSPYRVFTPFSRAWRAIGWADPVRAPASVPWAGRPDGIDGIEVPDGPTVDAALPTAGEPAAKRTARRFWDAHLDGYDDGRDRPAADATSRLSPHLKFGTIHPRQLLAQLGRSAAHDRFRLELCWREFYADVLFHRPDSAWRSYQPKLRAMAVDDGADADERLAAWAEGRTGFPFVDAGMRQLLAEAWLPNRLRMVVASFLVKDLHLDWTRGAAHFLAHLVDGDLASNQHGWQWTAGTGTDPAPYFRIFNPVTQGERYDPGGAYVRRWVPELAAVADRYVHHPWDDPAGPPPGYPAPIVDHAEERDEALRRYAALPDGPGADDD